MDTRSGTDTRRFRRLRWIKSAPSPAPQQAVAQPMFWREHWPIALVVLGALFLRLHGLAQRFVVFDESVLLDPDILKYELLSYSSKVWNETTYNPGWPVLVWLISRAAGISTFWARFPSALCGALTPLALYVLALSVGLKRGTALLASLVIGATIYQVEYGQQIMPHGALPLGACVCAWIVSRLGSPEGRARPWQPLVLTSALITVFGVLVFLHSSVLLLLPLLLGYLAWNLLKPIGTASDDPVRRWRWTAACGWLACALALGFASFGWFFAKAGRSDWAHLRPFFLDTFREAPDHGIVSDTLELLDTRYFHAVPSAADRPVPGLDTAYFAASRVFDFVYGQFKLRGEQQFTLSWFQWILPLAMVFLVARGAVRSALAGASSPAFRWVACGVVTMGLILGFSAYRLFPLGGIRHLIVLSPFVVLAAAVGLESTSRRWSWVLASLCLVWVVGDAAALPRYYRMTRDRLTPQRFRALAMARGVRDFVAADTICSEGALRLLARTVPGGKMEPADSAGFARITLEHRPFFLCALRSPIFEHADRSSPAVKSGNRVPAELLKDLAHPLVNLHNYRATQLTGPHTSFFWLDWTVYYMEPKPGPYPPEVSEVTECRKTGEIAPSAFVVRFSKPMNPKSINTQTVQLVARTPSDGKKTSPLLPVDVQYSAPTQTLLITPLQPLTNATYILALYRDIVDMQDRALEANDKAFYHHFLDRPIIQPRQDRGWLARKQAGVRSSKM